MKTTSKEDGYSAVFYGKEHERFYYINLKKCRRQDVYHRALVYCLGISADTRENVDRIYDFHTGLVKPECLHEGWQTSGSLRVTRLAFNLYCNGTPSVEESDAFDMQLEECRRYTVEELFCCSYARYFIHAVQIRYPEYFV